MHYIFFSKLVFKEQRQYSNLVSLQTSMPASVTVIDEKGVDKLLQELKLHKAAGPDEIKPLILKELHTGLTHISLFCYKYQSRKVSYWSTGGRST